MKIRSSGVLFLVGVVGATLLLAGQVAEAGPVETVNVNANTAWAAKTSYVLSSGDSFKLAVDPTDYWTSGKWTGDADGDVIQFGGYLLPGGHAYSLIGRIGNSGTPFEIGTSYAGTANAAGVLYLGMNDVPGNFGDNSGSLSVDFAACSAVPLPSAAWLGLLGFGFVAWLKRRNA